MVQDVCSLPCWAALDLVRFSKPREEETRKASVAQTLAKLEGGDGVQETRSQLQSAVRATQVSRSNSTYGVPSVRSPFTHVEMGAKKTSS